MCELLNDQIFIRMTHDQKTEIKRFYKGKKGSDGKPRAYSKDFRELIMNYIRSEEA